MNKEAISNKYRHYKGSDFLTDAYFLEWIYRPSVENEAFWKEVMITVPQQQATIENARLYLESVSFEKHTPTEAEVEASWEKHLGQIQALPSGKKKFQLKKVLLGAAAVVAGCVLIVSAWLMLHSANKGQLVASTGFGELKQVVLPDGSKVDLNANSKITYKNREVWLEGEALFNVKQVPKQFLVHTKGLTVTVLGTVFDIRQRRSKTEIVLQSGKIKLSFANGKEQDIIMTPGQIVSYNDEKPVTAHIAPEKFSAWKNQRLILQDPTVGDILVYLEDNFGKKIIMEDPALNKRVVNGPILISSLDDALFVLSTVLNTEIVKRDSTTIIMRSRSEQ